MPHFRDLQTSRAAESIPLRVPYPLEAFSAGCGVLCLIKTSIFVQDHSQGGPNRARRLKKKTC